MGQRGRIPRGVPEGLLLSENFPKRRQIGCDYGQADGEVFPNLDGIAESTPEHIVVQGEQGRTPPADSVGHFEVRNLPRELDSLGQSFSDVVLFVDSATEELDANLGGKQLGSSQVKKPPTKTIENQ